MPLSVGDRLGPYEIVAPIGAGGMGEVYRAHDSRLNRDVAIKVSNAQFTERFTREARAVAALTTPTSATCTTSDRIIWSWSMSKVQTFTVLWTLTTRSLGKRSQTAASLDQRRAASGEPRR
jgi:serine/threonine protein kinase